MSPTYTMSAHLCKQIYASWRQSHTDSPLEAKPQTPLPIDKSTGRYYYTPSSALPTYQPALRTINMNMGMSPPKRSMESDRSESD